MKKILSIIVISIFSQLLSVSVFAGSDGTIEINDKINSSKQNSEVEDCFETINRGVFAFNQGLDKIFLNLLQKAIDIFLNQ